METNRSLEKTRFNGLGKINPLPVGFSDSFDVHNVPAWDTWVGYFKEPIDPNQNQHPPQPYPYLISWIPSRFVKIVNASVQVNPEECINWLDDCEGLVFNDVWGDIKRLWYANYS